MAQDGTYYMATRWHLHGHKMAAILIAEAVAEPVAIMVGDWCLGALMQEHVAVALVLVCVLVLARSM